MENRIDKAMQIKMIDLLYCDFADLKRYNKGAFDGWEFVKDFDRHSPCRNMLIVTPNGSEIKIFAPNSYVENLYNEEFNVWAVWLDVFGIGEDVDPVEFDELEEVSGYLLEQWESNNL
jgi:hypothetical protein